VKFFSILKGQSSRTPEKNFADLAGVPLWFYAFSTLLGEQLTLNVDSDALKYLENLTLPSSWRVLTRESKHEAWEKNRTDSPVVDMLLDFCQVLENEQEVVCLTHATSPFVSLETFVAAARKLDEGYLSVQSVSRINDFAWIDEGNRLKPLNFSPGIVQRTQDLNPIVISKGAFFMARAVDILSTKSRSPNPSYYYDLSPLEAVEIDYPSDLEVARCIAAGLPSTLPLWNSLM